MSQLPTVLESPPGAADGAAVKADKSFMASVKRLYVAELDHLRDVVTKQQIVIDDLLKRVESLERELADTDRRADMFWDMASAAAQAADVRIGMTAAGEVGIVKEAVL